MRLIIKPSLIKTLLLVFPTLLLTSFTSFSQVWTANNPEWIYSYWNVAEQGFISITETAEVMIEGKLCKELTAVKHMFFHTGPEGTIGHSVLPYGVNYVYVSNDTVFYREGQGFKVLFDFSSQPGDSWLISNDAANFECSDSSYTLVDAVSAVDLGFETAVKLTLSAASGNSRMQQGAFNSHFGAMETYLFPLYNSCDSNTIVEFDMISFCSFRDDELVYNPSGAECDYLLTHLGTTENAKLSVKVYPNPVSDQLTVRVAEGQYRCLITTASGEVVSESSCISDGDMSFSTVFLASGVYILQISGQNGVANACFVK